MTRCTSLHRLPWYSGRRSLAAVRLAILLAEALPRDHRLSLSTRCACDERADFAASPTTVTEAGHSAHGATGVDAIAEPDAHAHSPAAAAANAATRDGADASAAAVAINAASADAIAAPCAHAHGPPTARAHSATHDQAHTAACADSVSPACAASDCCAKCFANGRPVTCSIHHRTALLSHHGIAVVDADDHSVADASSDSGAHGGPEAMPDDSPSNASSPSTRTPGVSEASSDPGSLFSAAHAQLAART